MTQTLRYTIIGVLLALVHTNARAADKENVPAPLDKRAAALEVEVLTLAQKDTLGVAPKVLQRAKTWALEARSAGKKDEPKKGEQALLRARLELDLARELITLANLKRRVSTLKKQLAQLRRQLGERKTKLGERDEYLELLKVTRQ
ncbi:MAG: hypothetical protein JRH20_18365 [Deltaproteobacteria bacterium]|nr:hypothetical protein [Deltaproteobacteria bacterium]